MPTYNSSFLVSTLGSSGRVAFSSGSVGYFFPLLDSSYISVDNSVSGSTANYNPPASPNFPLLFTLTSTGSCRVRKRRVHPQQNPNNTAGLFTYAIANSGYTDVPAGTDLIRNMTIPIASAAAGTTATTARMFDVIRGGSYGTLLPANVTIPIVVNSFRDCWIEVLAFDGVGSASSGSILFSLVSDDNVVGY